MPDFSFPTWMLPKESPWDALLKGAQVDNMIAQNRFRNQQLYQQIQQQGVENDLREREFMVRSEAQTLQNNAMRRKFDGDASDLPKLNTFLKELQGEIDPDTIIKKGVPAFDNFENYSNAHKAMTGRLEALSTALGSKILNSTRIYNLKTLEGLDPVSRQAIMPHMGPNGLLNEEGVKLLQSAVENQRKIEIESKPTATAQDLVLRDKYLNDAARFKAEGNLDAAKKAEEDAALISAKFLGPSEVIETTPEGVRISRGGATGTGLTTAVKTDLQKQSIQRQDPMSIINDLEQTLHAGDVGFAGVVGDFIDRGVAQVSPEVANKRRIESRHSMRELQTALYKTMRSDSNITDAERKNIEKMTPQLGVMESLPNAKVVLADLKKRIIEAEREGSAALNKQPHIWAWTFKEISDGMKAGTITEAQAIDAVKKYFPERVRVASPPPKP